ncbi:unnamed protein product [Caenorhabditis angaria]|uniref:Uncharacterized protein n=1 Tax=Caenorhabditis angaria TaxID=860376 RepID=A0A9P1IRT0_9PELO|nr:unnamed protein product [Caenorhabditis angaria]
MRFSLIFLLTFIEILESLSYKEKLQFIQLQTTAYNFYLRDIAAQKRKYRIYQSIPEAITEFPPLKNVFFENNTVVGESYPNAAYVNTNLAYSRPRTVDDDLGLPLNQPVNTKGKTNFYYPGRNYADYFYYPYGKRK